MRPFVILGHHFFFFSVRFQHRSDTDREEVRVEGSGTGAVQWAGGQQGAVPVAGGATQTVSSHRVVRMNLQSSSSREKTASFGFLEIDSSAVALFTCIAERFNWTNWLILQYELYLMVCQLTDWLTETFLVKLSLISFFWHISCKSRRRPQPLVDQIHTT